MFSYRELKQTLSASLEFANEALSIRSLSIDTRTLERGDLFVALPGERCDGAQFIPAAFQKGASGVLVASDQHKTVLAELSHQNVSAQNLVFVPDPQAAMATLSKTYRNTLSVRVVGVTGSVGKTTTKEFLYYLLRQKYQVLATSGNLNNHLGVPIMLSRLDPFHQMAVLEMGASHPGEIRYLAEMARPSAGILTPIGPAHLEGFGSLEKVYETKLELADTLGPDDPLVVPDQDALLLAKIGLKKRQVITVGLSVQADYRLSEVTSTNGRVSLKVNGHGPFLFSGQASFLALNAGLAIAMARNLGVSWEEVPREWDDVGFASGRFRETILANGVRVIDDSYNANPISFRNAIEAFRVLPGSGKKILVFADMRELGKDENRFHAELGQQIALSGIDCALAYGDKTRFSIDAIRQMKTSCQAKHFSCAGDVIEFLKGKIAPGDRLLFKGSRSMHVEEVLAGIKKMVESTQT